MMFISVEDFWRNYYRKAEFKLVADEFAKALGYETVKHCKSVEDQDLLIEMFHKEQRDKLFKNWSKSP